MIKDKQLQILNKNSLEAIKQKRKKQQRKNIPQQQYQMANLRHEKSQKQLKPIRNVQNRKVKPQFLLYNKMNQKLQILQSKISEIKANIHKKNLQRLKKNVLRNQQLQQKKKLLLNKTKDVKQQQNENQIIKPTMKTSKSSQNIKNLMNSNEKKQQESVTQKNQIQIKLQNHDNQNKTLNLNDFITQVNPLNKKPKKVQNLTISSLVTSVPQSNSHAFDFNPYSPRSSIYYVSEVIKGYKDKESIVYEHIKTSIFLFNYFSHIRLPINSQVQKKMLNFPTKPQYQGKKTVIFDLDQTLIHCVQSINQKHQVKLPVTFPNGNVIHAGINIRPGARDILEALYKDFQLFVFTASHNCYANVVIDHLDPQKKYIQHRLYREHCHITVNGQHVKDLRIINRQLKSMVLIDNAAYSYAFQPENGIPIIPYYHGQKDFQLKILTNYIQKLQHSSDVRVQNRKVFKLSRYRDFKPKQIEKLVQELYINKNE